MAYGLKIWNTSGQVRLDTSDNTSKIGGIGQYTGTATGDPAAADLSPDTEADGADVPLKYGIVNKSGITLPIFGGDVTREITVGTGAWKGFARLEGYDGEPYNFFLIRVTA